MKLTTLVTPGDDYTFTPEYAEMRFTPWGDMLVTMAVLGQERTYVQFPELNQEEGERLLDLADAKKQIRAVGSFKIVTTKGVTMKTFTVATWKEA